MTVEQFDMSLFGSLDFEYRNSQERFPELVSAAFQAGEKKPERFWLFNSPKEKSRFTSRLKEFLAPGNTSLLVFANTAEGRCLESLGFNPASIPTVDLYLEVKLLRNKNNSEMYGKYLSALGPQVSKPPLRGKTPGGVSNKMLNNSLAAVVYAWLGVDMDAEHKDEMRDLILHSPRFEICDMEKILQYNTMDVAYLPALLREVAKRNRFFKIDEAMERGKYSAAMAMCEDHGIPIHMERLKNLIANQPLVDATLSREVNAIFPIFEVERTGRHVLKQKNFDEFVKSTEVARVWPKTKSGYSKEGDTLRKMGVKDPRVEKMRRALDLKSQLKNFRPGKVEEFLSHIGSDSRLRTSMMPYGTQSFRNAPKARTFIFAMSSVLRTLVAPPPGYCILSLDYKAQEFGIAAAVSQDQNMIEAYLSGDPYLAFAKKVGAIPEGGTKESHPVVRDLYKAVVLMLQFQAGDGAIHAKVNSDPSKPKVSLSTVKSVVRQHKNIFRKYWSFVDQVVKLYHKQKYLKLKGGYVMWGDNDNDRSTGNFAIQGTGALMMINASVRMHQRRLPYFSPLHDGFYLMPRIEELEAVKASAIECLETACRDVLGGRIEIGIDKKVIMPDEPWVEGKAIAHWSKLKEFFLTNMFDSLDELDF